MNTEKFTYTQNNVFVDAQETPVTPVVVKASRNLSSEEDSELIAKAPLLGAGSSDSEEDWLSSVTQLRYSGGLLSASGTTYSTNVVENASFTYEGGILSKTVETQTEDDGVTIRQTRTTDLTYDSEGLLTGITETVE